jgi:hypothetical protein
MLVLKASTTSCGRIARLLPFIFLFYVTYYERMLFFFRYVSFSSFCVLLFAVCETVRTSTARLETWVYSLPRLSMCLQLSCPSFGRHDFIIYYIIYMYIYNRLCFLLYLHFLSGNPLPGNFLREIAAERRSSFSFIAVVVIILSVTNGQGRLDYPYWMKMCHQQMRKTSKWIIH